jgi:glycosyltransferase involved in cell wall biosynthesis
VSIEYISPADRARMASVLGSAAVVTALSEYEAHPVALLEALTLGIPAIGLDTAGVADLVEDGLVTGVPRDAPAAAIAHAVVAALRRGPTGRTATLPTWDRAAAGLAEAYLDVLGSVEADPVPGR